MGRRFEQEPFNPCTVLKEPKKTIISELFDDAKFILNFRVKAMKQHKIAECTGP